jgi:amino acid transporter
MVTYSGSRVILEFARQGHLPFGRFFSRVHPKLHTPIASLGLLYVITLIFLLAPPPGTAFQFIMAFSNYGDYFFGKLSVNKDPLSAI